MGRFGECVVSTINLDNIQNDRHRAVAEHTALVFVTPAYFTWCGIPEQVNLEYYQKEAEGLFVNAVRPPDERMPPYRTEVQEKGQNKFEFNCQHNGLAENILHHIVLPEYCYLDEDEMLKLRNKQVTIYTHEKRQCITFIYQGPQDIHFSAIFTGPDENKFNELRAKPQPLVYDVSPDKKYLFSETPAR